MNRESQSDINRPAAVKAPPLDPIPKSFRRLGFYYCLASSLCYTLSFSLVRCLAGRADPDWILCVKESVSVITTLPIILVLTLRGRYPWPPLKAIGWILTGGFFNEFIGGRLRIWSFAVLGLVLANPLIQISTILAALILGAVFLDEKISPKKWGAFGIFTVAIIVISASRTGMEPLLDDDSMLTSHIGWGVLLALLTGIGYTIFYVIMRKFSRMESRETPIAVPVTFPMCFVCGLGVLTGGGFFLAHEGPRAFVSQPASCWVLGFGAGIAEMTAFMLLNIGLRYATASKVTMIAVSQLVFLTFLGRFAFHEPTNIFVWAGVALTCVGIVMTADLD